MVAVKEKMTTGGEGENMRKVGLVLAGSGMTKTVSIVRHGRDGIIHDRN
jgi:hypothetical protein